MIERERHQRELDCETGHDKQRQMAREAVQHPLLAPRQEAVDGTERMKRDDRGDRGETHLEAWADHRLGRDDQHHHRARPNQPQAHCLTPERDPGEYEQRGNAAAHRRHLRPGQQRISDPGDGGAGGGNQHEIQPQRQRLAKREQPQRQEHRRRHDRSDVQPADRQQMRQSRSAHRVGVFDRNRILVATDEGGRDGPGRAGEG